MLPKEILEMRLQHLKENVAETLKLINDFEVELRDEDDPGRKSKYRRRIEDLNQQKVNYEKQLEEIVTQLTDKQTTQVKIIANDLEEIKSKLDTLLENQTTLRQMLLSHFTEEEQALVQPLTQQLNETELIEMQTVIEVVDTDQLPELEIKQMLDEIRQHIIKLRGNNILPKDENINTIIEMINQPSVDAKNSLKVSIPIIPFLLSYEGRLEIGINLKEAWERLKQLGKNNNK